MSPSGLAAYYDAVSALTYLYALCLAVGLTTEQAETRVAEAKELAATSSLTLVEAARHIQTKVLVG